MSYKPIPLVDMDSSTMDPLPRRRKSKPSSSTDAPLRFLLGILLLVSLGIATFYAWTQGLPIFKRLSKSYNPHSALHAAADGGLAENEVVHSLFGDRKDGGFERFDLVASIFVMDRGWRNYQEPSFPTNENETEALSSNETDTSSSGGIRISHSYSSNGGAVSIHSSGLPFQKQPEWERVWSEVVMWDMDVRTASKKVVAKPVLPGRLISIIQDTPFSLEIQATFHLQPPSSISSDLVPLSSTHYLSTLNTTSPHVYYSEQQEKHPLPYPAVGRTVSEQKNEITPWASRLAGSRPMNLLEQTHTNFRGSRPKPEPEDDSDIEEDDGSSVNEFRTYDYNEGRKSSIVTRSAVTLVSDFPTYGLASFRKKMNNLKNRKARCMRGLSDYQACRRTFTKIGHFENLIRMGSFEDLAELDAKALALAQEAESVDEEEKVEKEKVEEEKVEEKEAKGWRYAPFVSANYGSAGVKDVVEIPKKVNKTDSEEKDVEAPDFAFEWHISFATVSPLRLSLSDEYLRDGRMFGGMRFLDLDDEFADHTSAKSQDKSELINSLLGHPYDENSRPILRFLLRQLSNLFFYASILLSGHYWFTRSYSTGIAISAYAIDTLVRVVLFFISAAFRKGQRIDFALAPLVLVAASLVWNLAGKLEWTWGGWIPISVTRRKSTHAERTSSRLDFKFGWSQRALATILAYLIFLYLPFLPDLISASPPAHPSLTPASLSYVHDLASTSLTRFIKPIYHTSRFVVFLAQSLLNHRSKTFGGSYKVVAFLEFGSEVLSSLPIVLSSRWGRWELMDPWKVTNLIEVVMRGVLVWQAVTFGKVKQEEEEEEE